MSLVRQCLASRLRAIRWAGRGCWVGIAKQGPVQRGPGQGPVPFSFGCLSLLILLAGAGRGDSRLRGIAPRRRFEAGTSLPCSARHTAKLNGFVAGSIEPVESKGLNPSNDVCIDAQPASDLPIRRVNSLIRVG